MSGRSRSDSDWQVRRQRVLSSDRAHVWHPYTPMDDYLRGPDPLVIERACGSRIYDTDGRSYIDGNSSWWVAVLGHQHPRLLRALQEQSAKLCHVALAGITHEPAAELALELCAVAPRGLSRVFYSDDGSTAVELAIKMCVQYWAQNGRPERKRFLALSDAFHGETLGVTALGGVEAFKRPFAGILMDCVHVPACEEPSVAYQRVFSSLCEYVKQHADSLAGIVVEPLLQGAGGMHVYSPALLRELRQVATESDVFLVADEVFTGYGRTGSMWACDVAGIAPDILCIAKGFTAGILPMAATLTTERIFDGFRGSSERALYYGHTYCGHPLGAAVAREVLRIYRDEDIVAATHSKARRIGETVERLARLSHVSRPRSLGMMGAVQVGESGEYLARGGWEVSAWARTQGVYLRPLGNVVYIAPPLNIEDGELQELLSVFEAAVARVAPR